MPKLPLAIGLTLVVTLLVAMALTSPTRDAAPTRIAAATPAVDRAKVAELVTQRSAAADLAATAAGAALREPSAAEGSARRPVGTAEVEQVEIRGRLRFPPGTPGDERVAIVLRGIDATGDESDWFLSAQWPRPVLGEFEVQRDGSFVVSAPRALRLGVLELAAENLYLESSPNLTGPDLPPTIDLEALLGGRLEVRLTSSPGSRFDPAVLVGRTLSLKRRFLKARFASGPPLTDDLTIEEGLRCSIGGLRTDHAYTLHSGHDNVLRPFAPIDDRAVVVSAGGVVALTVQLVDGMELRGQVIDGDGVPVAGADVRAGDDFDSGTSSGWRLRGSATTAADGTFELTGVHAGFDRLTVKAEGFLTATWEPAATEPGAVLDEIAIVLDRGQVISGVVRLPTGRPVAGARVLVRDLGKGAARSKFEATTGADGRFAVSGLTEGTFKVVARAALDPAVVEGRGGVVRAADPALDLPTWRVERELGPTTDLELRLARPTSLSGVAADDAGAPVTAFRIVAMHPDSRDSLTSQHRAEGYLVDVQSEDGSFHWDALPPGHWGITARADGYLASATRWIDVPDGGARLTFELERTGRIEGVVVDASGAARAGVRVTAAKREGNARRRTGSSATSDDRGAFAIEGLRAGTYAVEAIDRDAGLASRPLRLEVAPGQTVGQQRVVVD